MKLNFSKSIRWFRVKSLLLLAGLILSPLAVMAADSGYTNTATIIYFPGYSGNTVSYPPPVDATNFVNTGTWYIYTPGRYTTDHTLNYSNTGTMTGSLGWEFDYGPLPNGGRTMDYLPFSVPMSASFFNDKNGIIQAEDNYIANPRNNPYYSLVSWLWISATNIVNKGQLIGGAGGEIRLTGLYADLTRSMVEINPMIIRCSFNYSTNFTADTAIYDEYWGQTNAFPITGAPYTMDSSAIWNGTNFASPVFYVNAPCQGSNVATSIPITGRLPVAPPPSLSDSTTNITSSLYTTNFVMTNSLGNPIPISYPFHIFRQAVFVYVTNADITASNRFLSTGNTTNLFQTATVRFRDTVSGEELFLVDTLASSTNRGVLLNIDPITGLPVRGGNPLTPCTDPTYRPANYILSREDCQDYFTNGLPGVGKPTNNFLLHDTILGVGFTFTNFFTVQATYAGYSAYVDDLVRDSSTTDLTNLPGRIIINANALDLTKATITSRGAEITIQANHLISSTGAVVACQNLSYNLGSTNDYLNVTNLAGSAALGLHGTINAFSALWTNGYGVVVLNYAYNTTTSNYDAAFFTNFVEVDLHVLLVDARGLSATVPVTVQDLILHSTNMMVSDPMTVVHSLLFDGQNLTLLTNLTLSGNLQNWTYATAPNLRYFTNNGTLFIPEDAHFGDDTANNYAAFVNNGAIISDGSETINSDYFQNSGILDDLGGVFVTTSTGLVANASIFTEEVGGDVDFTGGALKLTHATIITEHSLYFNMTNALYDANASSAAGNSFTCYNGFNLLSKPTYGDLLGTTITDYALTPLGWSGPEVDHVWAGVDLGATQAGFTNNVAIGTLVLTDGGSPTSVNDAPLFRFSGTGANNALYVNNLDLSGLAYLDSEIQVDPNLVIYYANVIGTTAGHLTSVFGGRFVHVTGVTPIGYPGIVRSPQLSASAGSGHQFQLTVNGMADQTYIVQASTNLPAGNWVPIFTNNALPNGLLQFVDPDASSYPNRFYRVVTPP